MGQKEKLFKKFGKKKKENDNIQAEASEWWKTQLRKFKKKKQQSDTISGLKKKLALAAKYEKSQREKMKEVMSWWTTGMNKLTRQSRDENKLAIQLMKSKLVE